MNFTLLISLIALIAGAAASPLRIREFLNPKPCSDYSQIIDPRQLFGVEDRFMPIYVCPQEGGENLYQSVFTAAYGEAEGYVFQTLDADHLIYYTCLEVSSTHGLAFQSECALIYAWAFAAAGHQPL